MRFHPREVSLLRLSPGFDNPASRPWDSIGATEHRATSLGQQRGSVVDTGREETLEQPPPHFRALHSFVVGRQRTASDMATYQQPQRKLRWPLVLTAGPGAVEAS